MSSIHRTFCLLLAVFFLITANAQHLKKDGTPDRRYRENRTSSYTSTRIYHTRSTTTHTRSYTHHNGNYVYGVARDKHGRIKRSESAKREFMRQTGYAHGRIGYVVDHIVPLKRGGCDCPSNMQWQTKAEAREKDKREEP